MLKCFGYQLKTQLKVDCKKLNKQELISINAIQANLLSYFDYNWLEFL